MTKRLEGQVAIVTGGSMGLGRSIALALAEEGANVVVASRHQSELDSVAREIAAFKVGSLAIRTDVTQKKEVDDMAGRVLSRFKRIDILVNNAATGGPTSFITEIKEEDWDDTLRINLKGVFLCIQAVVPQMIKQEKGNIINLSSGSGVKKRDDSFLSPTRSLVYNVTKAGVEMFTIALAVQLNKFKINVNALRPGPTDTRLHLNSPPERKAQLRKPDEVRQLAVFLAMQGPEGITGQSFDAATWNKIYLPRGF